MLDSRLENGRDQLVTANDYNLNGRPIDALGAAIGSVALHLRLKRHDEG